MWKKRRVRYDSTVSANICLTKSVEVVCCRVFAPSVYDCALVATHFILLRSSSLTQTLLTLVSPLLGTLIAVSLLVLLELCSLHLSVSAI